MFISMEQQQPAIQILANSDRVASRVAPNPPHPAAAANFQSPQRLRPFPLSHHARPPRCSAPAPALPCCVCGITAPDRRSGSTFLPLLPPGYLSRDLARRSAEEG